MKLKDIKTRKFATNCNFQLTSQGACRSEVLLTHTTLEVVDLAQRDVTVARLDVRTEEVLRREGFRARTAQEPATDTSSSRNEIRETW